MTIQNPHDLFFRKSFGRPEIARSYLQEYLPAELRALLDLSQLTLEDSSFIDEIMKKHQTDLLYKTWLKNGRAAYIYFLFEHKSYPDPWVSFQLLRYMLRFWEWQIEAKQPLSPIVPLLIYHGEKKWRISTEFHDSFDLPEALRPYTPSFHYHLTDFSKMSDETIRGEIELRVTTAVLRAIFDPQLSNELPALLDLAFQLREQQTGLEYIRTILYYLSEATERVSREELEQALLQQGKKGEAAMATIAQEYIREGYEKGIERGMERGQIDTARRIARQLLAYHDVVTVSEMTGLRVEEVEKLREE